MTRTFTVQQEIDLIRSIGEYEDLDGDYSADAPSAPSSGTLITLLDRANQEAWEVWSASDEGWNTKRVLLDAAADFGPSGSFYALPDDFHRIRSVQYQVGLNLGWETLRRANATDDLWTGYAGLPMAYREFPAEIELMPQATQATVRLTYCPVAPRLSLVTDTVPGTDGYDLYLVYWTLVRTRQREDKDTSEFRLELERLRQALDEKSRRRDRGQSIRMRPRGGWPNGMWPVRPRNL